MIFFNGNVMHSVINHFPRLFNIILHAKFHSASSLCFRPPVKVTAPHANNYVNKNRKCLKVRLAALSFIVNMTPYTINHDSLWPLCLYASFAKKDGTIKGEQ